MLKAIGMSGGVSMVDFRAVERRGKARMKRWVPSEDYLLDWR